MHYNYKSSQIIKYLVKLLKYVLSTSTLYVLAFLAYVYESMSEFQQYSTMTYYDVQFTIK